MTAQEQFLEWLKNAPAELAAFVAILKKWYELQKPGIPVGSGAGPQEFHVGGTAPLTTVALSTEEIDSLTLDMADAVVKEKAIEFVKGFIAGIAIKGVL